METFSDVMEYLYKVISEETLIYYVSKGKLKNIKIPANQDGISSLEILYITTSAYLDINIEDDEDR